MTRKQREVFIRNWVKAFPKGSKVVHHELAILY